MKTFVKRIEFAANLAIIVVAILLGVVLVRNYLFRSATQTQVPAVAGIETGTKLSLSGVDWNTSKRTLVMALSTKCHFCTESAPFYQRLAQERARNLNLRLIAVFPQQSQESLEYLKGLAVNVDDVRQSELASLGVSGTPTLILLNNQGVVEDTWRGKLNGDREGDVLRRLQ
jgi:thiol-disulfide isomerase/thioredoxin